MLVSGFYRREKNIRTQDDTCPKMRMTRGLDYQENIYDNSVW
jgi:hypothetical protein